MGVVFEQVLPELHLFDQLDDEVSQRDVGSLECESAPGVWNDVLLHLGPELLNLERLHVLAINVHEQVVYIFLNGVHERDKLATLVGEHVLNGLPVAVGQLSCDRSGIKQFTEHAMQLPGFPRNLRQL